MTKNITLFEAARQLQEAFQIDPETGEYSDAYTSSRDLFERKGAACIAYLQDGRGIIAARKAMLKKAAEHISAEERHYDRLEKYISEMMSATGMHKLQTADGLFTAILSTGCVKAVEIDEGAEFPSELCNEPRPPTPSKTKIAAAIEAGQPIKGARIVLRDRFQIK